ncbi:MAG: hypothetical protein HUJ65_04710 [Oscillospiraceae bacterium]|nr:hypothetical protein [Oscillospiraceae bacterium]
MMAVEACNKIIEKVIEEIEEGKYNHGELPSVFIRHKDALNSCAMQLRALLVVAGLSDNDERAQPLMELLEKLAIDND